MYIQICDRCGKETKNKPAFLTPVGPDNGSYQVNGVWFGDPIILCDECLKDFDDFRWRHKKYKINFVEETDE
jgi:hypothetical protein